MVNQSEGALLFWSVIVFPQIRQSAASSLKTPDNTDNKRQSIILMRKKGNKTAMSDARKSIVSLISFSIYRKLTVRVVAHYFKENI